MIWSPTSLIAAERRQEQSIGLVCLADGFEHIEILSDENQLHHFCGGGAADALWKASMDDCNPSIIALR